MNRWMFHITTIITVLTLRACAKQSFEPFSEALVNFTKFFEVEQQVENMKKYSFEIQFNNTREKYMFIFYPLMGKCDEQIQQQYETVMGSFQNVGISGVAYGLTISTKVALKVGFMKAGVASLLKTAALSTMSIGALPILISVGTASYLYSNYKRQELKQMCSLAIKEIEKMILKAELKELKLIQTTLQKSLNQKGALLNQRIKFMRLFPQKRLHFNKMVKRCSAKVTALRKYMKNFIKWGNCR